jgi:hypothetical protein
VNVQMSFQPKLCARAGYRGWRRAAVTGVRASHSFQDFLPISFVDYSFLGQSRPVIANYTGQPGVELTYFTSGGSGEGGDQYTGLDRFGRIIDQRWRRTSNNADVERVKYGYDRGSNRAWRQNTVAGTGQDEFYTYDGLQQVKTLDRGTLNAGKTGSSGTPAWEEDWNYDPTGNWHGASTGYQPRPQRSQRAAPGQPLNAGPTRIAVCRCSAKVRPGSNQ